MAQPLGKEERLDSDDVGELTGPKFRALVRQMVELNAKKATLAAEIKEFRDGVHMAGVLLKDFDQVVKMLQWEPSDIKESFAARAKYAAWMELPGHSALVQPEFAFGDEASEADWESRGFIDGTTGRGVFGEAPSDCPPDRLQAWLRGQHRSTAANAPKKLEVVKP